MAKKKHEYDIKIVLKCLYAIRNEDYFYFEAYGTEYIEKLIKQAINAEKTKTNEHD